MVKVCAPLHKLRPGSGPRASVQGLVVAGVSAPLHEHVLSRRSPPPTRMHFRFVKLPRFAERLHRAPPSWATQLDLGPKKRARGSDLEDPPCPTAIRRIASGFLKVGSAANIGAGKAEDGPNLPERPLPGLIKRRAGQVRSPQPTSCSASLESPPETHPNPNRAELAHHWHKFSRCQAEFGRFGASCG